MLFLICTLFLTTTFAVPSLGTGEDTALAVAECVRKALDGGLPAAGIPNHNPLTLRENLILPINLGLFELDVNVTNIQIYGLVDFNFTQLVGQWDNDTGNIFYDYTVVYPDFKITLDYAVEARELFLEEGVSGSTSLSQKNLAFSGTYNQSTITWHLDGFTLKLHAESVSFDVTGLGSVIEELANLVVSPVVELVVNANLPLFTDLFVPKLQDRLNNLWFNEDHWYRVQAILDNC